VKEDCSHHKFRLSHLVVRQISFYRYFFLCFSSSQFSSHCLEVFLWLQGKVFFSPSPGFFQLEYGDLLIVMRVMGVPGKSGHRDHCHFAWTQCLGEYMFLITKEVAECSSNTTVNYEMMLSVHPVVGSCSQFSVCVGLEFTQ
jgi:hypothetical protein